MRRVFLDIGANFGQTLEVALDPRYAFDRVYAFEPARVCLLQLDRFRDDRLVIEPFGIGAADTTGLLFEPGTLGGSLYLGAEVSADDVEQIEIRDASAWLSDNILQTDEVWAKLNCEGSEADIIERLHATGQLSRLDHVLLSLDIERFPEEADRGVTVLAMLEHAGVHFTRREDIGYLVTNWLLPIADTDRRLPARLRYWTGAHLRTDRRLRRVVRNLIGNTLYNALAARIGPSRNSQNFGKRRESNAADSR